MPENIANPNIQNSEITVCKPKWAFYIEGNNQRNSPIFAATKLSGKSYLNHE